jgi:hypothetical protein
MFYIILIIVIILFLAVVSTNKRGYIEQINDVKYKQIRPNCPQLNDKEICDSTPGCFYAEHGCINNYRELQEPKKSWENGDFMIVY